ncbi:pilus assembly protein PilM [bacterium]|nr:pilus assembly protein PilM [bacterium]MBU1752577.1 pilus assembly protein PilM [bacterium]
MKITGIDIGKKAIRIAILQKGWYSSVAEVVMEEVIPAGETSQHILSTVSPRLSSSRNLIISIPRRYVFMKIIEMPSLKDADLKKALEYEAEEHIPYPIQDVVYDFCILRQAEKTRILLVAVSKTVLESYLEPIKGINAYDISVSVSSLAILSLCLSQEEEKDWMLCCMEESCHEVLVVRDGFLSLVQTIQGQEVESEISRVIENHQVKKIILAGDVSKQPEIISGIRVEEFVLPDSVKILPQIKYPSPVPVALALSKLSKSGLKINLYPERDMQSKKALNKQLKTGTLLLLLMVFCINLLFLTVIRRMESTLQLTRLEINRIGPRVESVIDNKASFERLTRCVGKLNKVILDTPCYLNILNELAMIVPTETRLEGVNIQGRKCRITGCTSGKGAASSVTPLLRAIEKSSAFEQVELVGGITKEMNMERFEIRMLVRR